MSSEDAGLTGGLLLFLGNSLPGLLLVLPVALGAGLAPGLGRDGGSPAFHTDAQELGLVPSFLGAAPHQFLALWSLGPLAFVLAAFLLPGFQLCWCRLYPWLRRPGLGRGLLPVGRLLFGLGVSGGCPGGVVEFLGLTRRLGSSNGKLSTNICLLEGFIPAWAGEPAPPSTSMSILTVYPRVGGGTVKRFSNGFPNTGLSPRGRGNQLQ